MQGSAFDEGEFFLAIDRCGARVVMIGRRALIALGVPVLTADYDFWLHRDDIEVFNRAAEPFDLFPNRNPEEARASGRYVLENDEHVDVLVARQRSTVHGETVQFEDVWNRRLTMRCGAADVSVPTIDDLIRTKLFAARPKDLEDIQLLESLRREEP